MRKLLIKIFIKDYKNKENPKVRSAYGMLSGIVGIFSNVFLAALKIIVGTIILSPAISADGINNLSDALSSIITLIGFKLSSKQADEDHPFGHQRMEYITGLIISFIILIIGLSLAKDSVIGLIDLIKGEATPLKIDNVYVVLGCLVLSILIKCWQSIFYRQMGKDVDSDTLKANSQDSLNDCITTASVLISTIIFIVSKGKINIDCIAGLLVSGFIIVSSIGLLKETIDPLLGEIPSDEEINEVANKIKSYEGVLGIHDLVFHNYGPNMKFVTVHVEVSREEDVMKTHDLIDNIEQDVKREMNIDLTIHMDPIEVHDELTNEIKEEVSKIINSIDPVLKFHDFRIVPGPTHTNVLFDVVMPINYEVTPLELKNEIKRRIKEKNETWFAVIQIDQLYNRLAD